MLEKPITIRFTVVTTSAIILTSTASRARGHIIRRWRGAGDPSQDEQPALSSASARSALRTSATSTSRFPTSGPWLEPIRPRRRSCSFGSTRPNRPAAGSRFDSGGSWYSQISPNLRRAVIVTEDAAFFDHGGIDLNEIKASFEKNWEEGSLLRGGSTITQQLAKNLYLSPSRNPARKLRELLIARRLEAAMGKPRIFELYLNLIEWGDGIFGCEVAAQTYFGKSASDLTMEEAALMAGAIINPREHNPMRPTKRLLQRQQIILRRLGSPTV